MNRFVQRELLCNATGKTDIIPIAGAGVCQPNATLSGNCIDLFPNLEQQIHPDLRECDFGMFEGKNYRELSGCPEYQAWIDSGGTLPFPDGESREQFLTRSCAAVSEIVQTCNSDRIAIVAHGGTMMAVFSACEMHHKSYFDWKIPAL